MSRRAAAAVNLDAFAEQLIPVLALAHMRLDRAGVSPAPHRKPWDQWRLDQLHTLPATRKESHHVHR